MFARLLTFTAALVLACASAHAHANAQLPQPETAHRAFAAIEETASRAEALLSANDIKTNCHRLEICASPHRDYANNSPYKFTDPDGRCPTCDRFSDAFAKNPQAFNNPVFNTAAIALTAIMAAPVAIEVGMAALANPYTATVVAGEVAAVGTAVATGGGAPTPASTLGPGISATVSVTAAQARKV